MRALVAGWFSFRHMNATVGDVLVRDLVCRWLKDESYPFDVAMPRASDGGVDFFTVDPARYTHVVFLCGPFGRTELEHDLLGRFGHCRRIGLNLSYLLPPDRKGAFDLLIERDSAAAARPDLTFGTKAPRVPVVGVLLVHPQREYGNRARHDDANQMIRHLLANRQAAQVRIDTLARNNAAGLRSPAEVESLIARMDAVITTRLHGMVLALKNGVPALAVDPIAGGAKISHQARVLGWPAAFCMDALDHQRLAKAWDYCLSDAGRARARDCTRQASSQLEEVRSQFVAGLGDQSPSALCDPERAEKQAWLNHPAYLAEALARSIERTIPRGEKVLLIDGDEYRVTLDTGHRFAPFCERDDQYWGPPADDAAAIDELGRQIRDGYTYLAIASNCFWWLSCYSGWASHLRSHFQCLLDDPHLVVFKLADGNGAHISHAAQREREHRA